MFVYVADMHPRMNESLGWSACMYVKRVFVLYRGFASYFSLESSSIGWIGVLCYGFPVHRGPLGRCLVRIASHRI